MRQLWCGITLVATLIAAGCHNDFELQHSSIDEDATVTETNGTPPPPVAKPSAQKTAKQQLSSYIESARVAETQGDWLAATAYYATAVDADPYNRPILMAYINAAKRAGLRGRAVQILARYNTHNPNDMEVATELGKALIAADSAAPAVELLRPLCNSHKATWSTCATAALAYDRLNQFEDSRDHYERALRLSPNQSAVLYNYALSRAMAGDNAGAQLLAQRALRAPGLTPAMAQAMQERAAN